MHKKPLFAALAALLVSLILLFGCISSQKGSAPRLPPLPPPPVLGGDSAPGHNLPQSADGGDRDSHGCIGSAGYSWCEEKQKCLREWEENCAPVPQAGLEAQAKAYCGSGNTVYICGEYIRVVSDLPGAGSKFYALGKSEPVASCPLVAPDSTSEQCSLLLFGSNCVEREVACNASLQQAGRAPGPVTDLRDDPSFVGAQLSWSAPDANAVDYAIYRGDESLTQVSLIKTTGQAKYDDVFNGGNRTYAYFVRARGAGGEESPNSNIVYVQQLSTSKTPSPGQID